MKLFATLSYFTTFLIAFLFLNTLKKENVPIPTKEKLSLLLLLLAFLSFVWISIALFK